MTPSNILITGATGFIGSRLCERLTLEYRLPYRALVRRFTRANRIARLGADMKGGDLLDRDSVASALDGCDTVVHLAHSEDATAPAETATLLHCCRHAGVRRFVHVSSMSVHGPNPGPECAREATATIGRYGEAYCDAKAEVEERVQAAVRRHALPAVILRPTVVYGPYGPFVAAAAAAARSGEVTLIDGGKGVCNAVYVDDVCDAIHAALTKDSGVGKAMFVTGDNFVTWRDFTTTFAGMVTPPPRVRDVSSDEARAYWQVRRPTVGRNVRAAFRLASSPSFHRELATVPAIGYAIRQAKGTLTRVLSEERKLVLKSRIQPGAVGIGGNAGPAAWPDPGRLVRETCRIKFSNQLAKDLLGWRPLYDLPRGAERTKTWLEYARLLRGQPASA